MCNKIAQYRPFPGTNVSLYQINVRQSGSQLRTGLVFLDGVAAAESDSGEILIALDWSTLSGGSVPSPSVAAAVGTALLSTNFLADLHGRALAELPLHLVGHSRGGSVVLELARVLGAQGIWVDQVTTMDPHPAFGDPPLTNYANILYTDNYWQSLGDGLFVPNGQAVAGAYNRRLINLNGGYSSSHSDAHLWYHGTIQLSTPASDTGAILTQSERAAWWTAAEAAGARAGFLYSAIAGGDRFSGLQPAGAGQGRISDGLNKLWDLGAGVAGNRSRLPANNGLWPNLVRLNVSGQANLAAGQSLALTWYYQFGANTSATGVLRFQLDRDRNPYNDNEIALAQTVLAGTGANTVGRAVQSPFVSPNLPPGSYFLLGSLTCNSRTRHLYAPEPITIWPTRQPPAIVAEGASEYSFLLTVSGDPGQKIVIERTHDLSSWIPISTNVLPGSRLSLEDARSPAPGGQFYRARLLE